MYQMIPDLATPLIILIETEVFSAITATLNAILYCDLTKRKIAITYIRKAGVAELVDATDLKSVGLKGPCRFKPDLRHIHEGVGSWGLGVRWK